MTQKPVVEIEAWADLTSPWCWIGMRRLERAARERPEMELRLRWRPFDANPELPPGGVSWERFLEERFEGADRAGALLADAEELGRGEGLSFRFDAIRRVPRTAPLHAVLLAVEDADDRWILAGRFLDAFFAQGIDIGEPSEVRRIAREEGLSGSAVAKALADEDLLEAVAASRADGEAAGARFVPFFRMNGRLTLTGAQPVEVLVDALDQAVLPARRRTDPSFEGPRFPEAGGGRRPGPGAPPSYRPPAGPTGAPDADAAPDRQGGDADD